MSEVVIRCFIFLLLGVRDELSDEEIESDFWINLGEVDMKLFILFNFGGKCVMCRNIYIYEIFVRDGFCRLFI